MKHPLRKLLSVSLAAVTALSMSVTAFADEPYNSYIYDNWKDAIPSQSAYRVEKTVTGAEMKLQKLRDPSSGCYISDSEPLALSDARDLSIDKAKEDARKQRITDERNKALQQENENLTNFENEMNNVIAQKMNQGNDPNLERFGTVEGFNVSITQ